MSTKDWNITDIYLQGVGQHNWYVVVEDAKKAEEQLTEFEKQTNKYCHVELLDATENGIITVKLPSDLIIMLYPNSIYSVVRSK